MERLRLLWVTPDLPRPGVSAARERWWALLARLASRHHVTLLSFVDPEELGHAAALPAGLADVHLVPRTPYTPDDPFALLPQAVAGGYSDPALRVAIAVRLRSAPFDLAQYEFVEMANLIPVRHPAVPTVLQLGFAVRDLAGVSRVAGARARSCPAISAPSTSSSAPPPEPITW
jgi:hypothetical protein